MAGDARPVVHFDLPPGWEPHAPFDPDTVPDQLRSLTARQLEQWHAQLLETADSHLLDDKCGYLEVLRFDRKVKERSASLHSIGVDDPSRGGKAQEEFGQAVSTSSSFSGLTWVPFAEDCSTGVRSGKPASSDDIAGAHSLPDIELESLVEGLHAPASREDTIMGLGGMEDFSLSLPEVEAFDRFIPIDLPASRPPHSSAYTKEYLQLKAVAETDLASKARDIPLVKQAARSVLNFDPLSLPLYDSCVFNWSLSQSNQAYVNWMNITDPGPFMRDVEYVSAKPFASSGGKHVNPVHICIGSGWYDDMEEAVRDSEQPVCYDFFLHGNEIGSAVLSRHTFKTGNAPHDETRSVICIWSIASHTRGNGSGSLMMNLIVSNCDIVVVQATTSASIFYEKMGFTRSDMGLAIAYQLTATMEKYSFATGCVTYVLESQIHDLQKHLALAAESASDEECMDILDFAKKAKRGSGKAGPSKTIQKKDKPDKKAYTSSVRKDKPFGKGRLRSKTVELLYIKWEVPYPTWDATAYGTMNSKTYLKAIVEVPDDWEMVDASSVDQIFKGHCQWKDDIGGDIYKTPNAASQRIRAFAASGTRTQSSAHTSFAIDCGGEWKTKKDILDDWNIVAGLEDV